MVKRAPTTIKGGYLISYVRNRGVGTLTYATKLVARCHICGTPEQVTYQGITTHHPLTECPRCLNLACPDHYDYHLQFCAVCADLYPAHNHEEDATQ